jgi:hypothetical protein
MIHQKWKPYFYNYFIIKWAYEEYICLLLIKKYWRQIGDPIGDEAKETNIPKGRDHTRF